MCLLRNLSYQVHREIPHAERYQETPLAPANNAGPHAASCFGAKKGKGSLGGSSMEGGGMKTSTTVKLEGGLGSMCSYSGFSCVKAKLQLSLEMHWSVPPLALGTTALLTQSI